MKKIALFLMLMTAMTIVQAQQLETISLTNVVNGQAVSLETFPSCSGVVIIFTSNSCPYDEHYRARVKKLGSSFQDKVPVILVNSNTEPAESKENMAKKAQQLGLSVPYLSDKDQVLMQKLGATKSPQAFLLKNNAGKFTVVYSGAIDDNAQVEADVRHAYLKDAIDIMLSNQAVATPEVRPTGCTIRRK